MQSDGCGRAEKPTLFKNVEGRFAMVELDAQDSMKGEASSSEPPAEDGSSTPSTTRDENPGTEAGDEADLSPEKRPVQGYVFEKPPPPIKTRRESHVNSPPELSPPPSPKRMRELERKEGVFSVILPPSQGLQQNL